MPQAGGCGKAGMGGTAAAGCWRDRVHITGTIAAKNHTPGRDILNRKTKSVNLYSAMIVLSKLTNRNQITNQGTIRTSLSWKELEVVGRVDVPRQDTGRVGWREAIKENTIIRRHVTRGA
jgi:hypothetical protein